MFFYSFFANAVNLVDTSVEKEHNFLENLHEVHIVVAVLLDPQHKGQLRLRGRAKGAQQRRVALQPTINITY